jgi:hypothetical protein
VGLGLLRVTERFRRIKNHHELEALVKALVHRGRARTRGVKCGQSRRHGGATFGSRSIFVRGVGISHVAVN